MNATTDTDARACETECLIARYVAGMVVSVVLCVVFTYALNATECSLKCMGLEACKHTKNTKQGKPDITTV